MQHLEANAYDNFPQETRSSHQRYLPLTDKKQVPPPAHQDSTDHEGHLDQFISSVISSGLIVKLRTIIDCTEPPKTASWGTVVERLLWLHSYSLFNLVNELQRGVEQCPQRLLWRLVKLNISRTRITCDWKLHLCICTKSISSILQITIWGLTLILVGQGFLLDTRRA